MKKWIALLALMCLCTVSGCTKKETPRSPTETTAAFLNGIQNQDSDAVKASSDWKDFNIKAFSVDDSDYMDSVDKKLQKQTYEKMMYFEHKEGKETIQDNQATVTVKIKQYDFSKTLKSGMEQAEKKVQELSKKDVSDAETEAAIATVLFKSLQKTDRCV